MFYPVISKFSITIVSLGLALLCACSPIKSEAEKTTVEESASRDSVSKNDKEITQPIEKETEVTPPLTSLAESPELILDSTKVGPEVKSFLSALTKENFSTISTEQGILLVEPGPGVYPTFSITDAEGALARLNKSSLLFSDELTKADVKGYPSSWDICQIIESGSDGVYLNNIEFKNVKYFDEDESVNAKLQSFLTVISAKTGIEMLFKFRNSSGNMLFLHLFTIKRDDKLFLMIIDQHECGA